MAMRDGDLSAAFLASVDSRIWRADSRIMEVIKFAAVIERQQSQKFIGCHLSFKHCLSSTSHKGEVESTAFKSEVASGALWANCRTARLTKE
jgi:hypothetical protein